MPEEIQIQIGPTIRKFNATLPDGTPYDSSIAFATSGESRQVSDEELEGEALALATQHWEYINDPENARLRQDYLEYIEQIESLVDLSNPIWVDDAFQPFDAEGNSNQTHRLLTLLLENPDISLPLIDAREILDQMYGPLWARWKTLLG